MNTKYGCLVIIGLTTIMKALSLKERKFVPYDDTRKTFITEEELLSTGGSLHLNSLESEVDDIFLKFKNAESLLGFQEPGKNAAEMHFFKAKPLIDNSKVFKFLQKMPKGAVLHAHNSATVSSSWVVKNIFYMSGLMRCNTAEGVTILSFRQLPPKHKCVTEYVSVSDERNKAISSDDYDRGLEKLINLYTPKPELEYTSVDSVWKVFQNMFRTIGDSLLYIPAYRSYHWQMLEELYDDNVMYIEVRLNFDELYDIDGNVYPAEKGITELIDVVKKFKLEHQNFLGLKMIYTQPRGFDIDVIRQNFETFKKLQELYPDYIIGYDLVGQEDKGKPLYDFISMLEDRPKITKYFFHAGETNWYGTTTDFNLLDAILLNSTRIGHGYALIKHPVLWNLVKTNDIAVEVSPISNQVLNLVWDLRNHPGSFFISQNIPMVICNDDPGFWNAKALSYDFYYAIMSFAPNNAGLKTLKQLVWNSIKYSVLQPDEEKSAYEMLQIAWDNFINDVLQGIVI